MALDLGKLLRAVNNADLIVTPQYNRWLITHPEMFPMDPAIADVIYRLMTTKPRVRAGSFSSSSAGKCLRRQCFDFVGTTPGKDVAIDPKLQRIFDNGTWNHMRTQVRLLQAGILDDIELPLPWPKMREQGTADGAGTVPDSHPKAAWRGKEFGFEFKTANEWSFKSSVEAGPDAYLDQAARYMLKAGWELYVIFMENKNSQETHEWVLEKDASAVSRQRDELAALNRHVETKTLPARLAPCQKQTGDVFRGCPYGGKGGPCVRVEAWPGV